MNYLWLRYCPLLCNQVNMKAKSVKAGRAATWRQQRYTLDKTKELGFKQDWQLP